MAVDLGAAVDDGVVPLGESDIIAAVGAPRNPRADAARCPDAGVAGEHDGEVAVRQARRIGDDGDAEAAVVPDSLDGIARDAPPRESGTKGRLRHGVMSYG